MNIQQCEDDPIDPLIRQDAHQPTANQAAELYRLKLVALKQEQEIILGQIYGRSVKNL